MLFSVRDRVALERRLGLLENRRILVAAPSGDLADTLRDAFRQRGSRLVTIQADGPELDASQVASANSSQAPSADAIRQATMTQLRSAYTRHGGLDIIINVVSPQAPLNSVFATINDTEQQLSLQFQAATTITQVAAGRMALTRAEGIIISILDHCPDTDQRDQTRALLARSLLQAMTRSQAATWASKGIRINAIAPHVDLTGAFGGSIEEDPSELADIALYLASSRAPQLSGLTFAPEDIAGADL